MVLVFLNIIYNAVMNILVSNLYTQIGGCGHPFCLVLALTGLYILSAHKCKRPQKVGTVFYLTSPMWLMRKGKLQARQVGISVRGKVVCRKPGL